MKYYQDYITPKMQSYLMRESASISGIEDLHHIGEMGGLETKESFKFLCDLYNDLSPSLKKVLEQRKKDRDFIDLRTKALSKRNKELNRSIDDEDYETVLGLEDSEGRIVVGPLSADYGKARGDNIAPIPSFLEGVHVTLFGPPGNAKLSINAMNAFHRKLKNEPAIISEILSKQDITPMWGADDEDSKTPLRSDLIIAGENLSKCFDGTLELTDERTGKEYKLCSDKRSLPIKRFPGLALPCSFLFYKDQAMPLHLYDFALHLFKNWHNPKALVFYVPKLENEEEASYIKEMIDKSEAMIKTEHPEYKLGSVRVLIVLENPRAVFRVNEMMDALHPYFVGASLGWHDYLGSTARLFKEDEHYRIPVKADPDIVIKHIKGSHQLLAEVVGKRGGIKIGGMYGILPISSDINTESFQVAIKGFVKDVVTQLKRDLNGFWVAHPDFVRLGLALVQAWKEYEQGDKSSLWALIKTLVFEKYHEELFNFILGDDISGLDYDDILYKRSLIVADIKESSYIKNNDPEEIRYNVFQSLQYLTDWLSGNGCVALPAQVESISVRMMDDLATAERSRWEVWHEVMHNRFDLEEFLKIAHEEMNFIRRDLSHPKKIVQVKWDDRTSKWYPVALNLMIKLMTDQQPVEFATEYLMPFTIESIRESNDPWAKVLSIDENKFKIDDYSHRFNYYFEICGDITFAKEMANDLVINQEKAKRIILSFNKNQILSAASFHGNIGESKQTLDAMAKAEQAQVLADEDNSIKETLISEAAKYIDKYKMKFLISAQDKSTKDLLDLLKARINNDSETEEKNAKIALWEITQKRMNKFPLTALISKIEELKKKHKVIGTTIAVSTKFDHIQSLSFGQESLNGKIVTAQTWFEFASLSKSVGAAFAIELFAKKNISLNSTVNEVLKQYSSSFRLSGKYRDDLKLYHLMSHSALNMHYVNGIPANKKMPKITAFLNGNAEFEYDPIQIINEPGTKFKYSGAGFILLEYLVETIGKNTIIEQTKDFLSKLGMEEFSFEQENLEGKSYATGYDNDQNEIEGTRKMFPAFAAGSMGNAISMNEFLCELTKSFHNVDTESVISHNTAVQMLHGTDIGSMDFMGTKMGLGIFTANGLRNKFAIHQGANDGFRSIFIYCYDGPDLGKGITIQSSGDDNAMLFNAHVCVELLKELSVEGLDWSKVSTSFSSKNITQEEIVNLGYKQLIFNSFIADRAEEIIDKGEKSNMLSKNLLLGSKVLKVSNEGFARVENLISTFEAVFDPKLFGRQGKIMDSWETVRHNHLDCDYIIYELAKKLKPKFVFISTKYHLGNQVDSIKLLGKEKASDLWKVLLRDTKLNGHSDLRITLESEFSINFLKVEVYPDGGLTRLAIYEEIPDDKDWQAKSEVCSDEIKMPLKPLHLPFDASLLDYEVTNASNEHYAPASQILSPYMALSMFDGCESARSRKVNHHEEIELKLKKPKELKQIKVDFEYFVNNNPNELEFYHKVNGQWVLLVERTDVKAFAGNKIIFDCLENETVSDIKINIYPDGGFNRIYFN
jgi:malate synthase